MANDIDTRRLSCEITRYRTKRGMSLDDFGPEHNKLTLSRMERCEGMPDAGTIAQIASTLGLPIDAFLTANRGRVVHYADAPLIEIIAAVVEADQTLTDRGRNALIDLMTAALEEAGHA